VCNKLHHPAIIPEQGASKIVKISQQMTKLCRKLKWLVFFLGHGVNYANEKSSEPRDDAGLPKRPSRDRRRPARFLSAISVRGAAVDERGGHRHLEYSVNCKRKQLSCEEQSDYTGLTCSETLSVASDDEMPDKRKRNSKRRHRTSDSSDSETDRNGRRRPRQQQPRVPFEPRYCGQCAPSSDVVRNQIESYEAFRFAAWYLVPSGTR